MMRKMTDIFLPGFLDKWIYFVQTNLKICGDDDAVFLSSLCPVLLLFHNFHSTISFSKK